MSDSPSRKELILYCTKDGREGIRLRVVNDAATCKDHLQVQHKGNRL